MAHKKFAALRQPKITSLGQRVSNDRLAGVGDRFKRLADRSHQMTSPDCDGMLSF